MISVAIVIDVISSSGEGLRRLDSVGLLTASAAARNPAKPRRSAGSAGSC